MITELYAKADCDVAVTETLTKFIISVKSDQVEFDKEDFERLTGLIRDYISCYSKVVKTLDGFSDTFLCICQWCEKSFRLPSQERIYESDCYVPNYEFNFCPVCGCGIRI